MDHVVLVADRIFTPYAAGEVFSFPVDVAKVILAKSDGAVRLYDEKKDADLLAAMSGKKVVAQSSGVNVVKLDAKTLEVKSEKA